MAVDYVNPLIVNATGNPNLDTLKTGSDKLNNALHQISNDLNGADSRYLRRSLNLGDILNVATARSNLGLGTAATANTVTLLARANHTGTQLMSTISNAGTAATRNIGTSSDQIPLNSNLPIFGTAATANTVTLLARANHTGTQLMSTISNAGDIAVLNTNASTSNYLRGDGTWVTPPNTNTTYSEITTEEIDDGTSSTLRTITGRRMKHALDKKSDVGHVHSWNQINDRPTQLSEFGKDINFDERYYTETEVDTMISGVSASGGLPTGGTEGQILRKKSTTTYDSEWFTLDFGTAATRDVGAGADEVPLNSDLPDYGTAATANTADLLARANHTGTQLMSTISDAGTAAIMDAVSTGSGDPDTLGALVQYGTGQNGDFWRYAGGMQVCRKTVVVVNMGFSGTGTLSDMFRTGIADWTFPIAFIVPPTYSLSFDDGVISGASSPISCRSLGTPSTTKLFAIQALGGVATGNNVNVYCQAIGRWK